MVAIAQLVRASDCDSEGRGFEPHWLPKIVPAKLAGIFMPTQRYLLNSSQNKELS